MRLRLSDPELADNLRDFSSGVCGCPDRRGDARGRAPHELHAQQARLELDLYLRVWQSIHDWSAVEYVEKLLGRADPGAADLPVNHLAMLPLLV